MMKTARRCLKGDLAEEESIKKKAAEKRKVKEDEQLEKALRDHYTVRATQIDEYLEEKVEKKKQKQEATLKGKLMELAE